jgi:hypothetical protein
MARRLRDVDTGDQGEQVRFSGTLAAYGFIPAYLFGRLAYPHAPTLVLIVAALVGPALLGRLLWPVIAGASQRLIGGISATGGDSYTMQHSEIEALVARGNFPEAAERYREIAATSLTEADPHIRLGDLLATHLRDDAGATAAYHAARSARPTPAEQSRITNALIDLHRKSGNQDALKDELLRFAQLHPNTPAGKAAREEVRRMVRGEVVNGER